MFLLLPYFFAYENYFPKQQLYYLGSKLKKQFRRINAEKLLLQAQTLDDLVVFLFVGLFEVFEVASSVGNHLKKAPSGVLILEVLAEVCG